MIEKDHGIALRTAPYSNTSRYVLWFTREHGRLATLIKGAIRPKSFFLGQFDLFYLCDLVFYAREHGGVHLVRECKVLDARPALRHHWRACVLASYLADLCARALPDRAVAPAVFEWLDRTLSALEHAQHPVETTLRAELGLCDLLGFRPILDRCAVCQERDFGDLRRQPFSPKAGGRVCPRCAPRVSGAMTFDRDAYEILATWQRTGDMAGAAADRPPAGVDMAIERLLGSFLRHHLELDLASRRLAFADARRRLATASQR